MRSKACFKWRTCGAYILGVGTGAYFTFMWRNHNNAVVGTILQTSPQNIAESPVVHFQFEHPVSPTLRPSLTPPAVSNHQYRKVNNQSASTMEVELPTPLPPSWGEAYSNFFTRRRHQASDMYRFKKYKDGAGIDYPNETTCFRGAADESCRLPGAYAALNFTLSLEVKIDSTRGCGTSIQHASDPTYWAVGTQCVLVGPGWIIGPEWARPFWCGAPAP